MRALRIVLLCVLASILYGVLHDLVTAHVCVEYFSVTHPRIIASDSPVWLALAWGVAATWWVGLGLGLPLALSARAGAWPKLSASDLVVPLAAVLIGAGLIAGLVGLQIGGAAAAMKASLPDYPARVLTPGTHARWIGVWATHVTSYSAGLVGGLGLCVHALAERRRRAARPRPGATP